MNRAFVLLLTLFCVSGSIIFAIHKTQITNDPSASSIPVPAIKPVPKPSAQARSVQRHLDLSSPKEVGHYGRLSLETFLGKAATEDIFLAETAPNIGINTTAPKTSGQQTLSEPHAINHPLQQSDYHAAPKPRQLIYFEDAEFSIAQTVNLPYLHKIDDTRLIDRVVDMAETSPVQPDSRDCGPLKHSNLKNAPKHAKVRSVSMQRHLTNRTSISIEYVYKDGCYKNAIAPLKSLDMPGDDGVNLRFNMKF